jgi:hypothetical protein
MQGDAGTKSAAYKALKKTSELQKKIGKYSIGELHLHFA